MKTAILVLLSALALAAQTPTESDPQIRTATMWSMTGVAMPQYAPGKPSELLWVMADASAVPSVTRLIFELTCADGHADSRVTPVYRYASAAIFQIDRAYAEAQKCKVTVSAASTVATKVIGVTD